MTYVNKWFVCLGWAEEKQSDQSLHSLILLVTSNDSHLDLLKFYDKMIGRDCVQIHRNLFITLLLGSIA